ncbi:MAG: pyruvate, water dikinase regulatory protein [Bacillota bacterium]|nr:kinase/pyrophosphorylase [Bacillota bacterium]MDD3299045.1 kinase/pyrophosphorylase [Bacillota bacterium]MDD3851785.1 kinase/pyrophosphorylase [Bacillota bacterium]MDD4708021.1 kinase/pyrophosphorylase [Bacillota bacterium]
MNENGPRIFIVSDSIGETAEKVVKAVAIQFNSDITEIRKASNVTDKSQIIRIIQEAKNYNSIVVYTIVLQELKIALEEECDKYGILRVDILGPLMEALSKVATTTPRLEAGLIYKLDEQYFKRVDAVEFAVKYDDGKDPRGILKADAVIIGVSRTSKTPLSMYLAHKNYKVANVPLVPEISPPQELFKIPPKRIVGLTADPEKLNLIRRERLKTLGLKDSANYASMERILLELEHADALFKKLGCTVIDVSKKAVEETASIVIQMLKEA